MCLQGILGFFGGLSREDAEEIERLAVDITYTEEEEKAVRLKVDLRILPIIVFSYLCKSLCHICERFMFAESCPWPANQLGEFGFIAPRTILVSGNHCPIRRSDEYVRAYRILIEAKGLLIIWAFIQWECPRSSRIQQKLCV